MTEDFSQYVILLILPPEIGFFVNIGKVSDPNMKFIFWTNIDFWPLH